MKATVMAAAPTTVTTATAPTIATAMKAIAKAIAILLPLTGGVPALAGGADAQLFDDIFPEGGQTLYCQNTFAAGTSTHIDRLYPQRQLEQHFGCSNSLACRGHEGFLAARNDLHQMFPIERRSDLDRRGALFGETRTEGAASGCGYRLAFQIFEPPDHAKGDVARAMLYMHTEHGVPLVGTLEMYQRWNRMDPPDDIEHMRNERIAAIQGNRNPYIDAPEQVDQLTHNLPNLP